MTFRPPTEKTQKKKLCNCYDGTFSSAQIGPWYAVQAIYYLLGISIFPTINKSNAYKWLNICY